MRMRMRMRMRMQRWKIDGHSCRRHSCPRHSYPSSAFVFVFVFVFVYLLRLYHPHLPSSVLEDCPSSFPSPVHPPSRIICTLRLFHQSLENLSSLESPRPSPPHFQNRLSHGIYSYPRCRWRQKRTISRGKDRGSYGSDPSGLPTCRREAGSGRRHGFP